MDTQQRYTDWEKIGKGGHANVYRVFDQELQFHVAIKLLNQKASKDRNLVEGMRREVIISRSLRHQYICPIHDLYDGERGIGIVMDLMVGNDLGKWLKENQNNILGTMEERLQLLKCLTRALLTAHSKIVHRDLKPSNVFLLQGEILQPVIMDFGLSTLDDARGDGVSGTPKYMAPEQWSNPSAIDLRTDIFALGIMAYEICTGRIPPNSNRNILKTKKPIKISISDIPVPSKYCPLIPPSLDTLILQMTAFEQRDRPQNTLEILKTLDAVSVESTKSMEGKGSQKYEVEVAEVKAEQYYLGSPPSGQNTNEKPAKRIELSPFRIGIYCVTNADYRKFVEATGAPRLPLMDTQDFGQDLQPAVGVLWEEANMFADWVGASLPSEAQWECAARGGLQFSEYPWGMESPASSQANIGNNWERTTPVNAYLSGRNPDGIWDLCGNVWEWCRDDYDPEFYRSISSDTKDPVNITDSDKKVIRGGSFQDFEITGRCAFRGHENSAERRSNIGFRIVYN
ncbi:MAG: hypothetical protein COB46_05945 [Rhodospirillaceae bacterium]|nr:MAG: hypothetical protein COB46_05945 [Rhodospirillaceae bacterium]